ncbi:MAG: hypothetical protein PUE41_06380, partial [bacterium]|nr:hypothetical protein [bacterium]
LRVCGGRYRRRALAFAQARFSPSPAAQESARHETPCSIRMAAGGGFPSGKPAGRSQREVFGAFF